jgi:poly-gamma-glutamate synthesis protein (capsule biosynthesis protein)
VLFDLGDFFDDYAVDQELRNDLGLLWLLELDTTGLRALRALPLALDYCFTRAAVGEERRWVTRRLQELCAPLGTRVVEAGALLDILT